MSKPFLVNYDDHHYNYKSYWKNRNYENIVEQNTLKKLLKRHTFDTFIDIGGSFGRALPTYYNRAQLPIIIDYSIETLQKNYAEIKSKYPRTELIAGNAYHLPFLPSSISGGMMIRTLHHIEFPDKYLAEVKEVLSPNGIYIQEYANKHHIKAMLKALFKRNWTFFNHEPYQQPSQGYYEGAKAGESYVFLNFSNKFITALLKKNGFKIKKEIGTSFFRIPAIKKFVPTPTLVQLDLLLQKIPGIQTLAPSVYIKTSLEKTQVARNTDTNIYRLLACPKCKTQLTQEDEIHLKCYTCNTMYEKKNNIWDLRYNG